MTEEDEQLCMSYALGALDPEERVTFEGRLANCPELVDKVSEFETLYAEEELENSGASNARLKEAIMTQISGDQTNANTSSTEGSQPMLASQAIALLVFGVVIVVACFAAFAVSLAK